MIEQDDDGGTVAALSYRELDDLVDACAHGLVARGLQRGERIGILGLGGIGYIAVALGAMKAGIVPVPLNHKLAADDVAYMAAKAQVRLVLAQERFVPLCPRDLPRVSLDGAGSGGFDGFLRYDGRFEAVTPGPDDDAIILFTSGSTGRPKGVPLNHEGQIWWLDRFAEMFAASVPDDEHFIAATPFYHMAGIFLPIIAFHLGVTSLILPNLDVRAYVRAIAAHRCSFLSSMTPVLARIVHDSETRDLDLSFVRNIEIGSAPLTPNLLESFMRRFPSSRIMNHYGSTEAGWFLFDRHPDGLPIPEGSLGYPLPGLEARLTGGPDDDEGVLEVRAPSVFKGYLDLPVENAERFRDGWFITNDRMRRDRNGFHSFVGRSDDMFVCNGENVFPAEIEARLEQHDGVRAAFVVAVPDRVAGHVPVAFVVAEQGARVTADLLRAHLLARGPGYQCPRAFEVIDAMPFASSGKVNRAALTARARVLHRPAPADLPHPPPQGPAP